MKTLIPLMLLTLLFAAPTNAEDLFEIKFGTPLKKIQKRYPDLKKTDENDNGVTVYSARTKDSLFHRISFVFGPKKRLLEYQTDLIALSEKEGENNCQMVLALLERQCGKPASETRGQEIWDHIIFQGEKRIYGVVCFHASKDIEVRAIETK